jgi:transcriptional regulator with XRE-family HTH domain
MGDFGLAGNERERRPLSPPHPADAKPRRPPSREPVSRTSPPIGTVREVINAHIGGRIRALRLACGKTQMELGDVLGLTNQQVQKYEKGTSGINLEKVWTISRFFGVDITYFLDGLDEAALDAMLGFPSLEAQPEHRRLRLALAEALNNVRSPSMLRGMLQLLRAAVDDQPPDAGDSDA